MVVRRAKPVDVASDSVGSVGNAGILDCWPTLVEFLTATTYDDGAARQLPTLLVFVEAGTWRLWLNDRDQARSCWAEAGELEEALGALERGLLNDDASWRRTVPRKKKGGAN